MPVIKNNYSKIIDERYVLIAPPPSTWENEKKLGYQKFCNLAERIESDHKTRRDRLL